MLPWSSTSETHWRESCMPPPWSSEQFRSLQCTNHHCLHFLFHHCLNHQLVDSHLNIRSGRQCRSIPSNIKRGSKCHMQLQTWILCMNWLRNLLESNNLFPTMRITTIGSLLKTWSKPTQHKMVMVADLIRLPVRSSDPPLPHPGGQITRYNRINHLRCIFHWITIGSSSNQRNNRTSSNLPLLPLHLNRLWLAPMMQ